LSSRCRVVGEETKPDGRRPGRDAWTPTEVATYLQVPVRTLYTWRYQRKGPRAHRVGRHLRYRWEDVESWLASEATSG
jgi:excisionase family DNA binding protein